MNAKKIFLAGIFAAALISCNKNTPKEVARQWLTDFYHMDFEDARKYSTEETKDMLNTMEGFSKSFADSTKAEAKKVEINVKSVREEGDNAYVTFSASNDPQGEQPPLKLVKVNDKWLVQFTKNDFKPAQAPDSDTEQQTGNVSISVTRGDSITNSNDTATR